MLVKTAVARKLLFHCWKKSYPLAEASIYSLDAAMHFGAAVDASLIVLKFVPTQSSTCARVFGQLSQTIGPAATIALFDGMVVADLDAYEHTKHLGGGSHLRWRSGIKHDCSKVMELFRDGDQYRNGFGKVFDIEPDYLFPMLKTSDVAGGNTTCRDRCMLVTQRRIGEPTEQIRDVAPKTWDYLLSHRTLLAKRGSSIYQGKPDYSIFGVGDYSFAHWKVAISGMYKTLRFVKVGPIDGKPVVFDDTANFVPCTSQDGATLLLSILESELAQNFYRALIFWDAKRPITVELLRRLNVFAIADELGVRSDLEMHFGAFCSKRPDRSGASRHSDAHAPTFW